MRETPEGHMSDVTAQWSWRRVVWTSMVPRPRRLRSKAVVKWWCLVCLRVIQHIARVHNAWKYRRRRKSEDLGGALSFGIVEGDGDGRARCTRRAWRSDSR